MIKKFYLVLGLGLLLSSTYNSSIDVFASEVIPVVEDSNSNIIETEKEAKSVYVTCMDINGDLIFSEHGEAGFLLDENLLKSKYKELEDGTKKYKQIAWVTVDGVEVDYSKPIEENTSLYVKYDYDNFEWLNYTAIFIDELTNEVIQTKENLSYENIYSNEKDYTSYYPSVLDHENYNFIKWEKGNWNVAEKTITYKAIYSENTKYTVTFKDGLTGETIGSEKYYEGTNLSTIIYPNEPVHENHELIGWSINIDSNTTKLYSDITIEAIFDESGNTNKESTGEEVTNTEEVTPTEEVIATEEAANPIQETITTEEVTPVKETTTTEEVTPIQETITTEEVTPIKETINTEKLTSTGENTYIEEKEDITNNTTTKEILSVIIMALGTIFGVFANVKFK